MELYIKNNTAYFKNIGFVPNKDLKINLNIGDIDFKEYNISVKINDFASRSCLKSFTIKQSQLKSMEHLKVDVVITHRATGKKRKFKMDSIPIRKMFAIGGDSRDMYPVALKDIQDEVSTLKRSMRLIKEGLVELDKRGEIL